MKERIPITDAQKRLSYAKYYDKPLADLLPRIYPEEKDNWD